MGISDKNSKNVFVSEDIEKDNITSFDNKENSYEDIINSIKYKNKSDLVKVNESNDKIFNYTLIKKCFEEQHPSFVGKLSKVNKNSSNIKIKTNYKDMYYVWLFRNNALEILLEFSNNKKELTKYFNSIQKEMRQYFNETLIVGQTKTKTVVYISTVKYSIQWAVENMNKFISIINNKLEIFYNDKNNRDFIDQDNDSDNSLQNYKDADNSEEKIEENDIFEEQEYVNLNIIDGQSSTVQLTRYERNPKNRAEAIKIHGTTCLACGFNFNDFYGAELAKDFIEIHHIKPVSQGEYEVNPKTDLVPLCSNCHSMIHKEKNPPSSIEEIRNRYRQ